MIFPLHDSAVRRLLLLTVPDHAACNGASAGCRFCRVFLHMWRDCLLGAIATLTCWRCAEAKALQACDLWVDFDLEAGYRLRGGGAAVNVKVRKNDQFRQGHQPRRGVHRDPRIHMVKQLLAFMRAFGNGPWPGSTKRAVQQCPCPVTPVCPPLFPRSVEARAGGTTPPSFPASALAAEASPPPSRPGFPRPSSGCRAGTRRTWRRGATFSWAAPTSCSGCGRRSSSSHCVALPVLRWVAFGSARRPAPAGPGRAGPVQWGRRAAGRAGPAGDELGFSCPGCGPTRDRVALGPGRLPGFRRQAEAAAGLPDFG